MSKKIFALLIIAMISAVAFTGCASNVSNDSQQGEDTNQAVSEDAINQRVQDALKQNAVAYFNGLTNDTRNLITSQDLEKIIETSPDSVYILDIRKDEDFAKGHIKGANHKWWFDVDEILDQLPRDKTIVVYCYTGQSAGQVVGVLRMMGYDAVAVLGGWVNGWTFEKMPVTQ